MHPNREEIRKRIARRKRERNNQKKLYRPYSAKKESNSPGLLFNDDKYGFDELVSYEAGPGEGEHPLFRKEVFFFKVLCSAILFLVIAILFKSQTPALEPAKGFVQKGFSQDFQFAAVGKWYEEKFGQPLALLPEQKVKEENNNDFSIPASGKILEHFEKNGQGIMIETDKSAPVEAVNEGWIMFAGVKEGLGKTVVIQHSDKTESWYGHLDAIEVTLYQFISKKQKIGTVGSGADEAKGEFYFAIKKGEAFIDPIQVIRFE